MMLMNDRQMVEPKPVLSCWLICCWYLTVKKVPAAVNPTMQGQTTTNRRPCSNAKSAVCMVFHVDDSPQRAGGAVALRDLERVKVQCAVDFACRKACHASTHLHHPNFLEVLASIFSARRLVLQL